MNKIQKIFYQLPHYEQDWSIKKSIFSKIKNAKYENIDDFIIDVNLTRDYEKLKYRQVKKWSNYNNYSLKFAFLLLDKKKQQKFLIHVFPWLALKALEIEQMCKFQILIQNEQDEITLTKNDVLILIIHIFFCTTVPQNNDKLSRDFTMKTFLDDNTPVMQHKLLCILNYFANLHDEQQQMNYNLNKQKITFKRNVWQKQFSIEQYLNFKLQNITFDDKNLIESYKSDYHVDFANQYIGGGALSFGNVQEEILFVINPELLVTMLFCEVMKDNEAIIIIGAQQYSNYTGYGITFQFQDEYHCNLELDENNRKKVGHIAIDAIPFNRNFSEQFNKNNLLREIFKAVVGFQGIQNDEKWKIITGNWGCGAFGGYTQLKFVIQWIACSIVQRQMIYCSFQNQEINQNVQQFINKYKDLTIEDLLKLLQNYSKSKYFSKKHLFEYDLFHN